MILLQSQKNSLFEIIENNNFFSHKQFDLIENDLTRIEYKANRRFYFAFLNNNYVNSLVANYSPGNVQIIDATSDISFDDGLFISATG